MEGVKFSVNPGLVFREEDDGAFLFNPDTGELNCLNRTGAFIWAMCSKGAYKDEIVSELVKEFDDCPVTSLDGDVERFLKEMKSRGFIHVLSEVEGMEEE